MSLDKNRELSAKEKRIKEAVVKHYGKNMKVKDVAEDMDVNRKTIQRYLNSDFASNLKRVYSDREIYDLKAQLETEIRDSKKMAENLLAQAIQHEDATPRDKIKAIKEAQKIRQRHIEMLKELGIELEGEEKAKQDDEESEVMRRMREALKEKRKEQSA